MSSDRARDRASGRSPALAAIALLACLVAVLLAAGPVAASDPSADPSASPSPTATASPDPTPTPTPEPPQTVTFYGRGYGHGLGLSQYGARGRALAGQLAPEILSHYYLGTTLATQSTATAIRVLVMSGYTPTAAMPARVVGRGGTWTVDGLAGTWPADASATMVRVTTPAAGWRLRVADPNGKVLTTANLGPSVRIRPAASATRIQVWFKPSSYDRYRGVIRLIGSAGGRVTVAPASAAAATTLSTSSVERTLWARAIPPKPAPLVSVTPASSASFWRPHSTTIMPPAWKNTVSWSCWPCQP